jgi:lipopolysaccharide transport system ATP-binding protein
VRRQRGFLAFRSVSKRYRRGERADSLRDLIAEAGRKLLGRRPPQDAREFWAVRDVSFEVEPGKILGIIGANGAGKSTVLKLGTQIIRPTAGSVETRGRVGALIEIAAGFHPDLTGRENVFLQGAVMGMKRDEVSRRFDEIVAFADIDDFIDTPVKRYSSGMNARLGFAIAAHMDPDVLLIDEVLSVGDVAFQQKALRRLGEIVDRDIPIVLVSHQLDRIMALADEALLLEGGRVAARGDPEEVISRYLQDGTPAGGDAGAVHIDARSLDPQGTLRTGSPLTFEIVGHCDKENLECGVWLRSIPDGTALYAAYSQTSGIRLPRRGDFRIAVRFEMHVGPGAYALQPYLLDRDDRHPRSKGPMVPIAVDRPERAFGRLDLSPSMRLL